MSRRSDRAPGPRTRGSTRSHRARTPAPCSPARPGSRGRPCRARRGYGDGLVGQQIPVVRPHERVHADVVARILARDERRNVALVEFCGAVQGHVRPHRVAGPADDRAATEVRVELLQILDALGMRPEHEVGVGAQTGDVVDATNDDVGVLVRGEELLQVLERLARSSPPRTPGRTWNTDTSRSAGSN